MHMRAWIDVATLISVSHPGAASWHAAAVTCNNAVILCRQALYSPSRVYTRSGVTARCTGECTSLFLHWPLMYPRLDTIYFIGKMEVLAGSTARDCLISRLTAVNVHTLLVEQYKNTLTDGYLLSVTTHTHITWKIIFIFPKKGFLA